MSQTGRTFLVVASIVCLLVGVGIGWVAKPIGPEYVSKSDYDAAISERDTAISERDSWRSQYEELAAAKLTGEVVIGFLGSMSGALASYGENEATAAQLAVEEVNEILAASGAEWTLKLEVEDTQTLPDVCLEKVESFAARGVKLLVGPLSSGELANIMTYCNTEKILTISQSSTAPVLGFPDDFVYRFCPNDLWQGRAIARLMYEDGIRYVVPTWRGDAWGDGLEDQGKLRFEELGGTFLEGIRYDYTAVEFSAEAATLKNLVASAVGTYGADKVAVWAIGFEEVAAYFAETLQYDVLKQVKWYGSDGTVVTPGMVDPADPGVSAFAVATKGSTQYGFINPIFSPLPATWKHDKVHERILTVLGREADSYSYSVYDIVWAYAHALMAVGEYDPEAVKAILPEVTKESWGATGWVDLDENGDRKPTNYDLWVVEEVEAGDYEWKRVGVWNLDTDTITWL